MIDLTAHISDAMLIAEISARVHREMLPGDFYRKGRAVGLSVEQTMMRGKGEAAWKAKKAA